MLSVRFFDLSAARNEQLHHLEPSPSTSPTQRCRLQQIVAHIEPCSPANEHCSEASPADLIQTTSRRRKVQRGRAHACHVWINTLLQNQIEAGEVAFVLCRIAARAPNRLHQHPVRGLLVEWPLDLSQRQRDNFRTAMVRRRPKQFLNYMLSGILIEKPSGLSY